MTREITYMGESYLVLEYAFFVEAFTAESASLAMAVRGSKMTVTRALKNLYGHGYIERVLAFGGSDKGDMEWGSAGKLKDEKAVVFRITEKGVRCLGTFNPAFGAVADLKGSDTPAPGAVLESNMGEGETSKNRAVLMMQDVLLYSFFWGAGLNVRSVDKPAFGHLCSAFSTNYGQPERQPDDYRDIGSGAAAKDMVLREYVPNGLYYTAAEVRKGLAAAGHRDDAFRKSRFRGIAVTFKEERSGFEAHRELSVSVIYSFSSKGYMYMDRLAEEALQMMLKDIFGKVRISCLMTGKSAVPAAAIATGYAHARMKGEQAHRDRYEKQLAAAQSLSERSRLEDAEAKHQKRLIENGIAERMRSGILTGDSGLYREIYFVPVTYRYTGPDSSPLRRILFSDTGTEASRRFFGSTSGFTAKAYSSDAATGICRLTKPETQAVYAPVLECVSLAKLRNADTATGYTVVTEPEYAPVISQILGSRAVRFYDTDIKEIPDVPGYTDTGFPVGEDRYVKAARARAEKAVLDKKDDAPKGRISLSCTVPKEMADSTDRKIRGSGLTRTDYLKCILKFCQEENAEEFGRYLKEYKDSKKL